MLHPSRVYLVPGTSGLVLAGAVNDFQPGISDELPFVFPRSVFVTGLLVIPRDDPGGLDVFENAGSLSVAIVDEQQDAVISDGRGTTLPTDVAGERAQAGASVLLLQGRAMRPFPLQRPVSSGDVWRFKLQNFTGGMTMAGIYLFCEVMQ